MEFRLDGDQYVEKAQVYGEDLFETDFPFPLKIVPSWLTADGPWKQHIGGE